MSASSECSGPKTMRASRSLPEPAAVALTLALIASCSPSSPPGVHTPVAAAAPSQASVFFLGPDDFREGRAEVDLAPSPSGSTLLFVVPALGLADFRADPAVVTREMSVRASARVVARIEPAGHPLPAVHPAIAPPPEARGAPATSTEGRPLPDARSFQMIGARGLRRVSIPAHLSYAGSHYAFYDDDRNVDRFGADEYAAMSAVVEAFWPALVQRFGAPVDRDHDGRILVLVSRTAVEAQPGAQMAVRHDATSDDDRPEVVVSWSLDGYEVPAAQRQHYVHEYFPGTLLHETVHFAQEAAAAHAGVAWEKVGLPDWVLDGQAQLARFESGLGVDDIWSGLRSDPEAPPFFYPYTAAAVVFRWTERFGADAQRAFLRAAMDPHVADPFLAAFGRPEPLALAEVAASLRLDGTQFGSEHGLELPLDDVLAHLGAPPPGVAIAEGAPPVTVGLQITGHATLQVAHAAPVRAILATTGVAAAYVLVVRR